MPAVPSSLSHQRRLSSPISVPSASASLTQGRVACKRCFNRKRKCDKLQPRCTACVEADVECEVGVKGVERSLLLQTQELQRRVDWLESLLRSSQPSLGDISSMATGSTLSSSSSNSSSSQSTVQPPNHTFNLSTLVSASLSMQRAEHMPDESYVETFAPTHPDHIGPDTGPMMTSASQHPKLPTMSKALEIAGQFLSKHLQSHHCITKEGIEEDIKLVYGDNGLINPELAGSRFRCFSVIYLETSPAYHGGDDTYERDFGRICKALALREISNVVAKEDLAAVQALTLLCVYGVDIPGGPSLSQLVGFAARTAMAINLHRRDDIYLTPLLGPNKDKHESSEHNELRKNIFWAIYCLDRLAAFTLGQPLSIRDSDIDVDLPSKSNSFSLSSTSMEVSGIALRCHQINLRRLYGIVRETFYSATVSPTLTLEEKEATVADFVRQAQAWYAQSPLKAAFFPISDSTISRQVVDDISYHQMIMAAHRPSPLIPEVPSSFISTLKDSASLSIDLYRHYCKSKKVLIIWTHLYQIFMTCTTLIYCFAEYQSRKDLVEVDRNEIEARIEQCTDLLSKFGTAWPESTKYQIMFDNLVQSFRAQMQISTSTTNNDNSTTNIDIPIPAHTNANFWNIIKQPSEFTSNDASNLASIQQSFSTMHNENGLSAFPEDQNHHHNQGQLSQIEQPEVSLFDLFGNFPILDQATLADSTLAVTSSSTTTHENLFGSMGPPWECSPGSLGSYSSVKGT